jgi:hypothetical protein
LPLSASINSPLMNILNGFVASIFLLINDLGIL